MEPENLTHSIILGRTSEGMTPTILKVTNDSGNLMFDESHPLCWMNVVECQGEKFAFIVALDIGLEGAYLNDPEEKRYWGKFSYEDQENAIREILHTGGKWPQLKSK